VNKGILAEFKIASGYSLSGTNKTTRTLNQVSRARFEPVALRIQSTIVTFAIKRPCFFGHSTKSCLLHRLQKLFHRCKDKCGIRTKLNGKRMTCTRDKKKKKFGIYQVKKFSPVENRVGKSKSRNHTKDVSYVGKHRNSQSSPVRHRTSWY
jgi:hypothetical protein